MRSASAAVSRRESSIIRSFATFCLRSAGIRWCACSKMRRLRSAFCMRGWSSASFACRKLRTCSVAAYRLSRPLRTKRRACALATSAARSGSGSSNCTATSRVPRTGKTVSSFKYCRRSAAGSGFSPLAARPLGSVRRKRGSRARPSSSITRLIRRALRSR